MSGPPKKKTDAKAKEHEDAIRLIERDNLPKLPVMGKDFPLTAEIPVHQVHHIFWENILKPSGCSLMDYRWKPDAHDDVILRSTTEFVLKALERAAQGSEITIDVDDKGMYEARDKSARFIPIIPFGEKQPTQYKYIGVYMEENGRERLKFSYVVEILLKHEAIPKEVLERKGDDVSADPLLFTAHENDPTDLRTLFGPGGMENSVGGFLISILVHDPKFPFSECMRALMIKNIEPADGVDYRLANQDSMVSAFLPKTIGGPGSEVGFGGTYRDQGGMLSLGSAITGDKNMVDHVTTRIHMSGLNDPNIATGTGIPFTLSSSSVDSEQKIIDMFANYRRTVLRGVKRPKTAAEITATQPSVEDMANASDGRGTRKRKRSDEEEDGYEDEEEDGSDKENGHARKKTAPLRVPEKVRTPIYFPAASGNDRFKLPELVLLKEEDLVPLFNKHKIWKKQHDKRVYTSENGSLLFKAPVPSCSYMMESKYPRAMMHTMFPQAFMLSLAYKRKDMSPTCAFLYEAGTVTIQDQILAMGVSEQILPDGESVRKLQLPDVIGVTREAECRKIRKELLLNGTKVSGNLYRKFIDSCVTEFTSVLHGQNDYSSALNAINDYFCIKGKTRPMCAALPHFKGLCPGSDSTALDTMFFTEIGSNLPVYAEICYTNCASVWGLLYMLKCHYFPNHIIVDSTPGTGKSAFFREIGKATVPGTIAEWAENTRQADYQRTKKDEFSIQLNDEAPHKATKEGLASPEQDNNTKKLLSDFQLSLLRTVKSDGATYHLNHKIKVFAHHLYVGGSNSLFTVQENKMQAIANRLFVLPVALDIRTSNETVLMSSQRMGKDHEPNKTATFQLLRDQHATVSMMFIVSSFGVLTRPPTDLLDLAMFRMARAGTYNFSSLRDIGRTYSWNEVRKYKEATYCLIRSPASPLLEWKLEEVATVNPKTGESVLQQKIVPYSPTFDPRLLFMAQPFLCPSWDSVISSISVVWWHNVIRAQVIMQQLFEKFGLDLGLFRQHVRAADQKISFAMLHLDFNRVKSSTKMTDLMLPPMQRETLTPFAESMVYSESVDKSAPTEWLPANKTMETTLLVEIKEFFEMMEEEKALRKKPVVTTNTDELAKKFTAPVAAADTETSSSATQKRPRDDDKDGDEALLKKTKITFNVPSAEDVEKHKKDVAAKPRHEKSDTMKSHEQRSLIDKAKQKLNQIKEKIDLPNTRFIRELTYENISSYTEEEYRQLKDYLCVDKFAPFPATPTTDHQKLKSVDKRKINFGFYADNIGLEPKNMPYLPFAVTSAAGAKVKVNLGYMQIIPEKNGDLVSTINDLYRFTKGIDPKDKVPETTMFFSAAQGQMEYLPVLPDDVDFAEVPTDPKQYAEFFTDYALSTCEWANMPIMKRTLAPGGALSTSAQQAPSEKKGNNNNNTASGPATNNDGTQPQGANSSDKNDSYVIHVSVAWIWLTARKYAEHMATAITSPFTATGRKLILPIPGEDLRVNMEITLYKGRGSQTFSDSNFVSEKFSSAFENVFARSKKTGKTEDVKFDFSLIPKEAKVTLPPYDEEKFFCQKYKKRFGYNSEIFFPVDFRNYLETMPSKMGVSVPFFKDIAESNSSTREIHAAMNTAVLVN